MRKTNVVEDDDNDNDYADGMTSKTIATATITTT